MMDFSCRDSSGFTTQPQRRLFNVSRSMVLAELRIIILLGVITMSYVNLNNISVFPIFLLFLRNIFLILSFTLLSVLLVQLFSLVNDKAGKQNPFLFKKFIKKNLSQLKIMPIQGIYLQWLNCQPPDIFFATRRYDERIHFKIMR